MTIAICTTASISGAHLNPAISIAFAAFRPSKSFSWAKVKCLSYELLILHCLTMVSNSSVFYPQLLSKFDFKHYFLEQVLPYSFSQCLGAILGGWLNLVMYGSSIAMFEAKHGIIRSAESGIQSAKCFGEYFL